MSVDSAVEPELGSPRPPTKRPGVGAADEPVSTLRSLLGASDQGELEELRSRIEELERQLAEQGVSSGAVATVLAEAVAERDDDGGEFVGALSGTVRRSIHAESRQDADAMAEALFPVLGRATRMMLSELLSGDSASTNGKSFTVNELYLIERDTGLPIATLRGAETGQADADVVSGMLEGIRAFVQDSFNAEDRDGMRELQVGEVTVWVEWGPQAILAAVLRGFPTPDFRFEMAQMLEAFHSDFSAELETYEGDPDTFGNLDRRLGELRDLAPATKATGGKAMRIAGVLLAAALFVAIIVLAAVGVIFLAGR